MTTIDPTRLALLEAGAAMTREEAAAFLDVSPNEVSRLTQRLPDENPLPYRRNGSGDRKPLQFRLVWLREWLDREAGVTTDRPRLRSVG